MMKNASNEIYKKLPKMIQYAIEHKICIYYDVEKTNSVLFLPLFSCILLSGNEFFPIITYQDRHILAVLGDELNSAYIYPGYSENMAYYTEESIENVIKITGMCERLFCDQCPPWPDYKYNQAYELKRLISVFDRIKKEGINNTCSYINDRSIFNLFNKFYCEELDDCLKNIQDILVKQDKFLRPIVVLPREYIYECNEIKKIAKNIEKVNKFKNEFNARIFISNNNGGKDSSVEGISTRFYESLFENEFPVIKGMDDFMKEYSKIIMEEAKEAINFDTLINDIVNNNYGVSEDEVFKNIINNVKIDGEENISYIKKI